MNLQGKRVLITGGSSGIGLATAEAMVAAGARVCISGRRAQALADAVKHLGAEVGAVAADVATDEGRAVTLEAALAWLGGLDVLVNNAGGVRAGRLTETSEADIRRMVEVDLLAPILLTRSALPALKAGGNGLVINISSGIALVGMPFYTTYAAVKAGLAHFGEALRRELQGEGVCVLTVYPSATDTPMMSSSNAGPDLGFNKEPASAVAGAIMDGIASGALQVIRGGDKREAMMALNRTDPLALDQRFAELQPALEEAVRDHSAL